MRIKKTIIKILVFVTIVILTVSASSCNYIINPLSLFTDTLTESSDPESVDDKTSTEITTEEETTEDISKYENNPDYLTYKAANEKLNSFDDIYFSANTIQIITMKYRGKTEKTVTETIIPISVVGRISGDCKCCMDMTSRITANGKEQSTKIIVWADGEKIYVRPESDESCTITDRNDKSVELYNEMTSVDNLFWDELSADYFTHTKKTDYNESIEIKAVPSEYRKKKSIAEVEEALISTYTLMGATDIKIGEKSMELDIVIDNQGYLRLNSTLIKIEMEMMLDGYKAKVSSETTTALSCQAWWESVYVEIPEK